MVVLPGERTAFGLLFNANTTVGVKERIGHIRSGVTALLLGRSPSPAPGASRFWILVFVLAGVVLRSIVSLRRTASSLLGQGRSETRGDQDPRRPRRAAAAAAAELLTAGVVLGVSRATAEGPLAVVALFQPDLAVCIFAAAGTSALAGALRLVRLLRALRAG